MISVDRDTSSTIITTSLKFTTIESNIPAVVSPIHVLEARKNVPFAETLQFVKEFR